PFISATNPKLEDGNDYVMMGTSGVFDTNKDLDLKPFMHNPPLTLNKPADDLMLGQLPFSISDSVMDSADATFAAYSMSSSSALGGASDMAMPSQSPQLVGSQLSSMTMTNTSSMSGTAALSHVTGTLSGNKTGASGPNGLGAAGPLGHHH